MRATWLAISLIAGLTPAAAQETKMEAQLSTGTVSTSFVQSRSYTFEPLPDITAFELAQATKAILPFLAERNVFAPSPLHLIDDLPPEVKRHFKHHGPR